MATTFQRTTKRLQINKANATVAIAIGAASFVVTFSLVASRALWTQRGYQNRVIAAKEMARDQLKENLKAAETLTASYQEFVNTEQNFLGGKTKGGDVRDGDNAKLVLDSLPSKYDYPALATSLEKLVSDQGIEMTGISGTDDELNNQDKQSVSPEPVDMPISITIKGDIKSLKGIATIFEHSIRPIVVKSFDITASQDRGRLEATIQARTFYQPATNISIEKKVVR